MKRRRDFARALRIGLTGPIGCGKSTVAGWLAERGAAVVDADAIARAVTDPGEPALDAVLAAFGDAVRRPDGSLDRAALGRIVFADRDRLRELEAIIHPVVRPRIIAAIEAAEAAGATIVAIEAIRLVEGRYASLCDEVWLVDCDPAEQLARTVARGLPEADARQRIAAQEGLRQRLLPAVSRVVDTNGSAEEARTRVLVALEAAAAAGPAASRPVPSSGAPEPRG